MPRTPRARALGALLVLIAAGGCNRPPKRYPAPDLGGGASPGVGGGTGGAADGGGPDAGSGDASVADAGAGYAPSCSPVGKGLTNTMMVDRTQVEGGNAFADYLGPTCPPTYLTVVLTPDACTLAPTRGLYLDIPLSEIGSATLLMQTLPYGTVGVEYYDGTGKRYCGDNPSSMGSILFDTVGSDAGQTVSVASFQVFLARCDVNDPADQVAIDATIDVTVGRGPADACP